MTDADFLLRVIEDVTFAQLRTFACAARAGSFVKAAEQLGISQPAVSEQIDTLERRLGHRLFDRRRGTTPVLSADGEEALEIVQTILAASSLLFEHARQTAEKVALRISVGPFLRERYLRALVPRIYRDFPDIEIELCPTASSTELMRQIETGELDLATYALPLGAEVPRHSRQICELPLALVGPVGTRARLAAGEISLEDFQFIFPGSKDSVARWARKVLRDLGLRPRVQPLFIEFVDAIVQMVEDGHGIGHLMTFSVTDEIESGRIEQLDVALPPMRRLIGRSPYAPAVAREIEDIFCDVLTV